VPTDGVNKEIPIDLIPWHWTWERDNQKEWIPEAACLIILENYILREMCSKVYSFPPYQISVAFSNGSFSKQTKTDHVV